MNEATTGQRKALLETFLQTEAGARLRAGIAEAFLYCYDDSLFVRVLDMILESSQSAFGFFGYVDDQGNLVCPSLTRHIWREALDPDEPVVFPREKWAGMWGRSLEECRTLYANEGLRVPQGHVPLTNALCVPVTHEGSLIGQISVSNKPGGYGEDDVTMLEAVARYVAPILHLRLDGLRREKEQLAAEKALDRSEKRYRRLVDQVPAATYIANLDESSTTQFVSKQIAQLTGYDAQEWMEDLTLYQRCVHPDDWPRVKRQLETTHEQQVPFSSEYRLIRRDGTEVWVRDQAQVVPSENGRCAELHGVMLDVTHEKRAAEVLLNAQEELENRVLERTVDLNRANQRLRMEIEERKGVERALRKSEERFHLLAENIEDAFWILSVKDRAMTYVSPAFHHVFGVEPGSCNRRLDCYLQRVHHEDLDRVMEFMGGSESQDRDVELRVTTADGEIRWVLNRRFPVFDARGVLYQVVGVARDITNLKALQRQVLHNEKLASLGVMVSGVAHEINNPNNFITFNLPILADYLNAIMPLVDRQQDATESVWFGMAYDEFRADVFKLLENLQEGSRRINRIVDDLRTFARQKDRLRVQPIDLVEVVDKAVDLCRGKVQSWTRLEVTRQLPRLQVHADADIIHQVLVNLIINAAQACDKRDSWVRLKVYLDSLRNTANIEVKDNGCGMPRRVLNRIFDPFFTTKEPGKGTGLGLSLSHNLLQSIGGQIDVRSEEGVGTAFTVALPLESYTEGHRTQAMHTRRGGSE